MDVAEALVIAADALVYDVPTCAVALHVLADEVRRSSGTLVHTCRCGAEFGTMRGLSTHVGMLGAHAHGTARIGRVTGAETVVQAQARLAAAKALYDADDDKAPKRRTR